MLTPSDYLRFRKRSTQCARCGASLVENAKNPSILVDPDEAEAPTEAIEPGTPQPVTDPQAETLQPEDKPSREGKSGESSTPEKAGKEDEDHGFDRFDYCDICWDDIKEKAFFSFWIGRRTEKDQPARKLNRQERNMALVALFDTLSDRNEEETDYRPHLFFLAHLLMKFKIFKWQPARRDADTGPRMIHFIRTDSSDEVLVPDVEMPDEMIVKVKEEIETYLLESTGQEIRL